MLDLICSCHVGPVVRITPNEVHLSDPDNYDTIYHVGTKYYKSPEFYRSFGLETASFGIISNEQHRVRRAALNPRFSRKTVLENEDLIQSKVWQLCRRMTDMFHANKPVDLHHGFRAVSIDVITDYAFNNCYNLLDKADFGLDYFTMVRSLTESFWIFNQFPLLQFVALKSPMWLAKSMNKHIGSYLQMRQVFTANSQNAIRRDY
jgi:cytochrome P450